MRCCEVGSGATPPVTLGQESLSSGLMPIAQQPLTDPIGEGQQGDAVAVRRSPPHSAEWRAGVAMSQFCVSACGGHPLGIRRYAPAFRRQGASDVWRHWLVAVQVFLLLALVMALSRAQAAGPPLDPYRLSSGDTVKVQVYGEDDLSTTQRINDRGIIAFPFLGEIQVGGLTPGQIQAVIADKLRGGYLRDPQVTVTITEYRQFFVMGEVKNPGGFPYVPGLTVRKAISIAGGFGDRASRNKLFLIPDKETTGARSRVTEDSPVNPGDTLIVEESFF